MASNPSHPTPPASPAAASAPDRPLSRLLAFSAHYRGRIYAAIACSVINKIFDLAPPVLIGAAVDIVVEQEQSLFARMGLTDTTHQLYLLAGLTVLVWALESIFEYAYQLLWRNLAQAIQHDLRIGVYAHVQSLEMAWFEDRSSGGLMSVLNDDINQLERFLDGGANDVLQVATTVIVVGGAFFIVAPSIAWLAVLPIPIIVLGSLRFTRRMGPRYTAVREQVGAINGQLANNLGGIGTIKAFTAEQREVQRLDDASTLYKQYNAEAIKVSSAFVPLIRMAIVVGFVATLVVGGKLAIEGVLAVGAYSVLVFITQRLLWPLTRLGNTLDQYQRAMASTQRVMDLLDVEPGIVGGPTPLEIPSGSHGLSVRFEDVGFSYATGAPVLCDMSLEAEAGETIAVVGPTGAGKTSVVKLLLRFYDVTSGTVRIDGHDIRDVDLTSLRGAIGLVSQDVFLFHGSVQENIAYGKPDASQAEIEAAARVAEAHDFIEGLPDGYATVIGERGQKLSGGQRQRISIARAVLADPPILVLDEATSAVDNETEAAIQRSLEHLTENRTTVVIAHRLSTIRNADRIYVLEAGRVVEAGTHDALIAQGGLYTTLWGVQTGEAA